MEVCYWEEVEDIPDFYRSDCGDSHLFLKGGPKDNRFAYCPYCGKQLIQLITNEELSNEDN